MSKELLHKLEAVYGEKPANSPSPRNIEAVLSGDFVYLEPIYSPDEDDLDDMILDEEEIELIEERRNGKGLKK